MQDNSGAEEIIATIFFLMTRYSLNSETAVAQIIESHLRQLADHPDNQSQTIREISLVLCKKWQAISDHNQFHLKLVN